MNLSSLSNALAITRRELRDSLRDWRIVTPIALLTLGFPWMMIAVSGFAFSYATQFDPQALFVTVIPFSLMIVGFFPISFCLVIALETFVGEKERSSLEPLLAMPISDIELYIGKLLASMVLPLLAGYAGMTIFVVALKLTRAMDIPSWMVVEIGLLTGLEALLMVSGAVVVSTHTTSVRAANLLASFIIIPMTLLVQAESALLLNNRADLLWHIMAGLVVANLIVGRMGARLFNREEILSREMDELNLRGLARTFWGFATEGRGRFSIVRFYRRDVFSLLFRNRTAISVTTLVMLIGIVLGAAAATQYPIPASVLGLNNLDPDAFRRSLSDMPSLGLLPSFNTRAIFTNNVRSLAGAGLLGLFSFGSLALILLLIPMAIIGFFAGEIWTMGANPLQFLLAFILPHGIFELPAAILATALALQMGASLISPRGNLTAGQSLLAAFADFVRAFVFVVIPVLFVAAYIEANITPEVVIWLYGK
jgi:uncharacterized membrane protein SpoIIM required for sporulation/ABC-type transport system involved in multi-copper enzyme maturation permease subunit